MLINASQIMRESIGARRIYEFPDESVGGAQVSCVAALMRTDAGILVSATCQASQDATCARCLTGYTEAREFAFAEEYFPVIDILTGRKLPPRDVQEDLMITEHHMLDVADAIQQYLILEEPRLPICRPDCAGLCPQCGADRNAVSCTCSPTQARNEWGLLRDLWNAQKDG